MAVWLTLLGSDSVNVCELVAFENRDVAEDARGRSRLDWAVEFTRQGVDSEWGENDFNKAYCVRIFQISSPIVLMFTICLFIL
ncbi:unnamed protein product [Cylicocyclus nassatus]|uniref:Uncharacterized protein n=1 Tax=Cylicocyclus nassatus TaxID=53992 RepID=A0AA36M631_CYLNA|nr:unnamed protein product [Cylicocyclus nassatus]